MNRAEMIGEGLRLRPRRTAGGLETHLKRRIILSIALFLSFEPCGQLLAADAATYSLGDAGTLKVALPTGWTGSSNELSPPTILLKAPRGRHTLVQITPLPAGMTDDKLKDAARLMGDHYAKGSKEKTTALEEFKGANGMHGYVSSFTDATGNPGAFHFLMAGIICADKTYLAVTLYCDDRNSDDHTAALEAVKNLSVSAGAAPAKTISTELKVKSPDETWTLVVPGHWKVMEDDKSKDRTTREVTAVADDGVTMLSLFFDPPIKATGDASDARAYYLDRMKIYRKPLENLKQDTTGEFATLEYDQGSEGFKLHNINAYLSHNGVWVDVHISKSDFNEKTDRAVFDEILKGLKRE